MSHTFMRPKSAKALLSDDIVPIHYYVYPHCLERSVNLCALALKVVWYSPFTRGGKLGLVKALKSLDEVFETLLPRKRV